MRSGVEVFRYRGLKMIGVLNQPDGAPGKHFPAVLFLHGFPGAEKSVDIQRLLLKKGVASFALHFCGAWGSEGYYAFTDLVSQARAGLNFLKARDFVDKKRLAVFGFSMGGWTAINLAAATPALKAVAAVAPVGGREMVGPFTRGRITYLCKSLKTRPASAMYKDFVKAVGAMDPGEKVKRIQSPLLLIHGDADIIVPASVSKRIYTAAPGPKRLVIARGASHDFLDRREWLARMVSQWLTSKLI